MKAIERNIQIHIFHICYVYNSNLKLPSTKYFSSSEVIATMKQTKKMDRKISIQ